MALRHGVSSWPALTEIASARAAKIPACRQLGGGGCTPRGRMLRYIREDVREHIGPPPQSHAAKVRRSRMRRNGILTPGGVKNAGYGSNCECMGCGRGPNHPCKGELVPTHKTRSAARQGLLGPFGKVIAVLTEGLQGSPDPAPIGGRTRQERVPAPVRRWAEGRHGGPRYMPGPPAPVCLKVCIERRE